MTDLKNMADSLDRVKAARDDSERWRVFKETGLSAVSLFISSGTLVCCALPILLVSVGGLGAFVASLTSAFPFLIVLSQNKVWVFGGSAMMLALSAWLLWRPGRSCPSDPQLARLCLRFERLNRRVIVGSAAIWLIGFVTAFLLLPAQELLGL